MGGQNVKNTIVDKMLAIIAPHPCSGCGKLGSSLCASCKYDIIKQTFSRCVVCDRPSPLGVCIGHNKSFKNAWVVGLRRGVLQRVIGNFKFQNMKSAARELAELLDARLPQFSKDVVIVPVPTAPAHIRERGYDHMLLIAQHLAAMRRISLAHLLVRAGMETQHHANRQQRLQQAGSAFRLSETIDSTKHYIVLDDIITTGATIDATTQLLRAGGATRISVAVLARQPLD
jgi:ComF family protein